MLGSNFNFNFSFENYLFFSFQVVAASMCPEQTTPAWCEQCRKYQPTNQTRKLKSLPRILSLNAGMVSSEFQSHCIYY